ncbi:MAG: signal recognition particle receptor subunit alpha [Thermoprotei archaeon]
MLDSLRSSLQVALDKLKGAGAVDEKLIDETVKQVEKALLLADVSLQLVASLSSEIKDRAKKEEPPPGYTKKDLVLKLIFDELVALMGGNSPHPIKPKKGLETKIMLVGIEGSGKTTTAAKLALYYKNNGYSVGLISLDNYRLGAADQLQQLAAKINIPFYANPSIPIKKAFEEGMTKVREAGAKLVLIDTAGRHKDEVGLMKEIEEVAAFTRPDQVILVIDANLGQTAASQAASFSSKVKVGSIIITKMDGSGKGGGALSAVAYLKVPVAFIGVGEALEDLEEFDAKSFVSRLLGMGDLRALVNSMQIAEQEEQESLERIASGHMTLDDMLEQIKAFKKMGRLSKILDTLPIGGIKLDDVAKEQGEEKMKKWEVIIQSMNRKEREDPSLVDSQRIKRIAKGSGTRPEDVKDLIRQYDLLKKTMKNARRNKRLASLLGGARWK